MKLRWQKISKIFLVASVVKKCMCLGTIFKEKLLIEVMLRSILDGGMDQSNVKNITSIKQPKISI